MKRGGIAHNHYTEQCSGHYTDEYNPDQLTRLLYNKLYAPYRERNDIESDSDSESDSKQYRYDSDLDSDQGHYKIGNDADSDLDSDQGHYKIGNDADSDLESSHGTGNRYRRGSFSDSCSESDDDDIYLPRKRRRADHSDHSDCSDHSDDSCSEYGPRKQKCFEYPLSDFALNTRLLTLYEKVGVEIQRNLETYIAGEFDETCVGKSYDFDSYMKLVKDLDDTRHPCDGYTSSKDYLNLHNIFTSSSDGLYKAVTKYRECKIEIRTLREEVERLKRVRNKKEQYLLSATTTLDIIKIKPEVLRYIQLWGPLAEGATWDSDKMARIISELDC